MAGKCGERGAGPRECRGAGESLRRRIDYYTYHDTYRYTCQLHLRYTCHFIYRYIRRYIYCWILHDIDRYTYRCTCLDGAAEPLCRRYTCRYTCRYTYRYTCRHACRYTCRDSHPYTNRRRRASLPPPRSRRTTRRWRSRVATLHLPLHLPLHPLHPLHHAQAEESRRYASSLSDYLECQWKASRAFFLYAAATFTLLPYCTYSAVLY